MGRYLILLFLAFPAHAWQGTQPCYPADHVKAMMAEENKEPWGGGVDHNGFLVALFVNRTTREWQAARRLFHGEVAYLCRIAQGEGLKLLQKRHGQ